MRDSRSSPENREAHSPALSELVKNIENKHPYIQEGMLVFLYL